MIDIMADVVDRVKTVQGLDGKVYRKWPQKKPVLPIAIVSRISAVTLDTESDGSEVSARLTYSVDIYADSPLHADALASGAADALASLSMHRSGMTDMYDESFKAYRISMTVGGIVDKRGNTFRE